MNCATTNLKSVTNATWGTRIMIRRMHAVLSLHRIEGDGSAFALGINGLNGYNNGKQLSRMRAELLGFAVLNPSYGDSSRPRQDAPPTIIGRGNLAPTGNGRELGQQDGYRAGFPIALRIRSVDRIAHPTRNGWAVPTLQGLNPTYMF